MRTGSAVSLHGPTISLCPLPVEFSANYVVFVIRVSAASLPCQRRRTVSLSHGQSCGLGKSRQTHMSDTLVLIAITIAEEDATRIYLMNKVF